MLPDGSINPGEMTSFNHYALGAVADWLHRTVAGLAPAAPGYRRIAIHPRPGGGLTAARARHRTPYGMAGCRWQIEAGTMTVEVEIPANTSAAIDLPGQDGEPFEVGSGRYRWSYPYRVAEAVHPALTLDSPLGMLFDHPEAYARVMDIIARHNPEFAGRMAGQVSVTLRQAIQQNPNAQQLQAQVEAALASLAASGPAPGPPDGSR